MNSPEPSGISRRSAIQSVLGVAGMGSMLLPESSYASNPAPFRDYSKVKSTRLETFLAKPRWIFLKIHTDVGVYGLGEPLLEGRALTIQTAIDDIDIAIDFHGSIPPQTSKLLIKELEPYKLMFIEEPVQAQNVDILADIARGTHLPIAAGERIFTKWGFRELLEKRAVSTVQPDLCHAGGITEGRIIAGRSILRAGCSPQSDGPDFAGGGPTPGRQRTEFSGAGAGLADYAERGSPTGDLGMWKLLKTVCYFQLTQPWVATYRVN